MKLMLLRFLCEALDRACLLTHWANPLLCKLGLGYCHMARWSYLLDKKYGLGVWKKPGEEIDERTDTLSN